MSHEKHAGIKKVHCEYEDIASFLAEQRTNLDYDGLLVKAEGCQGIPLFTKVHLAITFSGDGQCVSVENAEVVWSSDEVAGQNFCTISLKLGPETKEKLLKELESRLDPEQTPANADELCNRIDVVTSDGKQVTIAPGNENQLHLIFEKLPVAEQRKLAIKGNYSARQIILRKASVPVLRYLLQNPQITESEIASIAALQIISPEILELISRNKDWTKIPAIRFNLIKNINTPVPIACRFVPFLHDREMRQLLKMQMLNQGVAAAIRRKLYKTG